MRLILLFFLFIYTYELLAQGEVRRGASSTVSSTSTVSTTGVTTQPAVEEQVSDLQKTVAELKSRLSQSNDTGFPFGKFTFSKKINVYTLTPTQRALKLIPSSLHEDDRKMIVSLIQQGYRSNSFQSTQASNRQISFEVGRQKSFLGGKKPWKLSITSPQSQSLAPINYTVYVFKDDFFGNDEKSSSESVDHVLISIQSGTISRIQVDAGGYTFSNKRSPILLRHISSRSTDRLFTEDNSQFIKFGSSEGIIKSYYPYTAKPYLIDDQEHHFTPSKDGEDTLLLSLKTDSDNYVKIRFFTDLLGLANQRNPLTQIEGTVRVVLNSIPIYETRKSLIHHIQLRVGNGRFDSNLDTLRLSGADTAHTELFRKANWYGNLKLALLSHRGNVDADLLIGLEGRLVKHVFADQLKDRTVFVGGPLIEAAFRYTLGPNASLNLNSGVISSRANRQPDIANNNRRYALAYVSAEADYAPFNSPRSRIFFRLNHYWNWTIAEPTITQVQLGYSGTLSGILGSKTN